MRSSPQGQGLSLSPAAARMLAVEAVASSKREIEAIHAEADAERQARKAAELTAREAAMALARVMQIEESERSAREQTVLELQAQLREAMGANHDGDVNASGVARFACGVVDARSLEGS